MKFRSMRWVLGALLVNGACAEEKGDRNAADAFTRSISYGVPATPRVTPLPDGVGTGPQVVTLPGDTAPMVVHPGDNLNFAIGWQGGPISSVNMSFSPGQYFSIPVPAAGAQTEGVVQIPASLAPNVCAQLGDICHQIACFEQVVTPEGTVSVEVARQLVLDCGGTGCGETGSGVVPPGDPCAATQECIPGSVCFNRFCVGAGSLRVSLAFAVDSDFDLHVLTPSGAEISFSSRTADGGELDVDQCVSPCGGETHAENVVFDGDVLPGQYEVWVVNFDGRAAGDFSVQVAGDVNQTYTGSLPAEPGAESMHFTFTL
jgi:hypothetical protein